MVCGPGESPESGGFGVGGSAKTAGSREERSLLPWPDSCCVTQGFVSPLQIDEVASKSYLSPELTFLPNWNNLQDCEF